MHSASHSLPAFLLVVIPAIGFGQARHVVPASVAQPATAAPQKLLLKIGLNPGRAFRYGGFHGIGVRAPLSVGAEYVLNSKFTLYSQADAGLRLAERQEFYGDQNFPVPKHRG